MRQGGLILAAGRVRSKKKKRKKTNPAAPKTHHEIHSSPPTATTSRRRATKHVRRVSPYSPASIDPGFVEIGLVHLFQSVTTNVTHTQYTDRQTDRQTNYIMEPCTHQGMTRLFCLIGNKRPHKKKEVGVWRPIFFFVLLWSRAGHRRKGSTRIERRKRKQTLGEQGRDCRRGIWHGVPAVLKTRTRLWRHKSSVVTKHIPCI